MWLADSTDRFWHWFYALEARVYSSSLAWLTKRHKMLAIILIWLGINSLIIQGLYHNYQRKILSFQVTPASQEALYRAAKPTRVSLPAVQIDLPVVETFIVDNIWQIPEDSVAHLASSARPGENSNIVMYGHNRWNILAKLHQLQLGAEIAVETDSGVKHTYVVNDIRVVGPSDVQYVLPTPDEKLTIYTCTGFFDSQRLIVIAAPSSVSSL